MTTAKARATKPVPEVSDPNSLLDDPAAVLVTSDLRELTTGQIEEIEDLIDASLNVFFDRTYRVGKVHRAIAFVVRKATDATFTYEQSADLKLCIRVEQPVPPTGESGS